ncbi:uncharacterized protein EI90DRAFT_3132353 [Cantharellus anzutake]|uniref:uncharacterized protein n=1 Tax=Cantharellus anzutake TaxID=1750568 RepID=UPI00190630A5|nr:uncharacterized protein EI90DRAFT_3132353 [Cantharellus anzutake]KAF8319831.1 hypothetical protein EI90DRAFT_3132353 [Cantharellus anzutake]
MSGPVSSVLPQQSLQSLPPSRALHPQAPPINFPSLAAPPPLPVFSGVHAQTSGSAACVSGSDLHTNFVGTQSSIPPLPVASVAPVPAAFRGIPSGGFSTTNLRQAGRVMNTFNIPSHRLSEYHLTATDTLEHIFYEVEGFKAVSAFSKKQDGIHVLRLAPYLDHLGGPLPDEIQTILNDGLSTPIQIHFCSGVRLYRGLGTDRPNLLHRLGGNDTAMSDVTLCNICRIQAASQAHLIHIHTNEQNDKASLMPTADETSSVSTVDNEINEGLESEVIAVGDASEVQTHRDLSDLSDGMASTFNGLLINHSSNPDSSLFYPSVSAISEFADCIRGPAPDDSSDSHPFLISVATQEDLVEKLKAEIISCYNDDTSRIALDKFARGLSFWIQLLFSQAPEGEQLCISYDDRLIFFPRVYFDGIPSTQQHKELAFVQGVIIALSIVHLSRLPHQLCCLSVLYHLGYGKSGLLTESILAKHHPKLAAALNEFKASGSFTAIEQIAVPYLDIDAAGAAPMIASDEARAVFSHKLLLACVRGPIAMEANDEEVAFSAGLNLHCSNGFSFGKLCKAYADGWEGLLESLDALGIQSFDDLAPTLSFVEPQTAVRLLRQHSEFQSFSSLIEGFLRRTGWPLGDSGNDPLGLANRLFRLGYDDLQSHLNSPGFRSQLLYRCATSSDSLLGGQQIRSPTLSLSAPIPTFGRDSSPPTPRYTSHYPSPTLPTSAPILTFGPDTIPPPLHSPLLSSLSSLLPSSAKPPPMYDLLLPSCTLYSDTACTFAPRSHLSPDLGL